jgi:hypothetical protein
LDAFARGSASWPSRTDDVVAGSGDDRAALTEGFQAAFLGGAGIAAVGLVLTLVLIRGSDNRAHVKLGRRPAGEALAEAEA